MYSFLNDLSITESNTEIDSWSALDNVMFLTNQLRKYKIERLRVPQGFNNIPIANQHSINQLLDDQNIDEEKKASIYSFLDIIIEQADATIQIELDKLQENKLIHFYLNDKGTVILTEAVVMNRPVISFACHSNFQVFFLEGILNTLSEDDKLKERIAKITNIFDEESLSHHNEFLIKILHNTSFTNTKWDPIKQPIWNSDTEPVLKDLKFPKSVLGADDKIGELRTVGTIIAEMNAWKHDIAISKLNNNEGQIRKIFRANSGTKDAYLSIDFKRAYGAFEIHDHTGKHQGQFTFKGEKDGNADPKHFHDIKLHK